MNLRFAAGDIRIRVSTEEFAELCAGKSIGLTVNMPRGHAFRVKLNQTNAEQWQFDSDPTGLWLSIPRIELAGLAQGLPAKEGIKHAFLTNQDELQISLEIDVKKGGKKD